MTAPALSSTPENEHPIETAEYLLSTPAIEESIGDIVKWIRNRFTGGMVVGPQRFGKSHLIDYCLIELSRYIPGISIKVAECSTYRFPAELAFLEEMLHDLGHVLATVSSCSKGRIRIVSFLNSEATSSGTRRIVLFFDEAQNLHEHHYRILMGFHNRLRRLGISLTVILVGQPSLRAQKSSFVGQDKKEIVARFMTHVNDFHGIRTQKELCECLESYDEHSEFPEGSKQSFTAHYYPVAFRNGCPQKGEAPDRRRTADGVFLSIG